MADRNSEGSTGQALALRTKRTPAFDHLRSLGVLLVLLHHHVVAIALAPTGKDDRAFCKYACPIPVPQRTGNRSAAWRMGIDPDRCTDCGVCETQCPGDIKLAECKNAIQLSDWRPGLTRSRPSV